MIGVFTFLTLCVTSFVILSYLKLDVIGSAIYDLLNKNEPIKSYNEFSNVLTRYQKYKRSQLPANLRSEMPNNLDGFIYIIPHNEVHRKIFLNTRINQFLSGDNRLYGYSIRNDQVRYLYINEELIKALFKMAEKLEEKSYDTHQISVNSAYRSRFHNNRVGGAPQSMHVQGRAADLRIGDINRDGEKNKADKDIVYKLLDTEIIRNNGGLGYYPGTMIIHMDVRGRRARWDRYSR